MSMLGSPELSDAMLGDAEIGGAGGDCPFGSCWSVSQSYLWSHLDRICGDSILHSSH